MRRFASVALAAVVVVGCSRGAHKPASGLAPAQTQRMDAFACSADGRGYVLEIDDPVQIRVAASPRSPLASARVCVQHGSERPRCRAVGERGPLTDARRGDVVFVVTEEGARATARLCPRPGTMFAAEFSGRRETNRDDADRPPPDVLIDAVRAPDTDG